MPELAPELRQLLEDIRAANITTRGREADAMSVVGRLAKGRTAELEARAKWERRIEGKVDRLIATGTATARDVQEIRGEITASAPVVKAAIDAVDQHGEKRHKELTGKFALLHDDGRVPEGRLALFILSMRTFGKMPRVAQVIYGLVMLVGLVVTGLYIYEKAKVDYSPVHRALGR